ncbi:MAG TPA: hypothetical protein VHZ78_00290 [Rhizomicrobium sp.]|jgi:hypothetical protein|nr:hypothetical protein [Rhizomicrobium sp.]
MSLVPVLAAASSVSISRKAERVPSIGDANSSRTLNGECAGEDAFRRSARGDRRGPQLSHAGTEAYAPLWNGPSLRPAFVAQVLGQVMMTHSVRPVPAYRSQAAQIPNGSFFDRDV